jgi:hypothetical protein
MIGHVPARVARLVQHCIALGVNPPADEHCEAQRQQRQPTDG